MSADRTRRPTSHRDQAEALFKPAPAKPAPVAATARPPIPGGREAVTLRIDRAVLAHFQNDGPGWQDRINDALRQLVGVGGDDGLTPDELNSSNDG